MAAVAHKFGVTRQRIQQIAKKRGFVIGHRQSAVGRRVVDLERKRGFDKKTWLELQKIGAQSAFGSQRRNAGVRGIAWDITFIEWWSVWENSGKWFERGKRVGQYVMARNSDAGAYAVGNVSIILGSLNLMDGRDGTHKERALGRVAGVRFVNGKGRWRASYSATHLGYFDTKNEAVAARRRFETEKGL